MIYFTNNGIFQISSKACDDNKTSIKTSIKLNLDEYLKLKFQIPELLNEKIPNVFDCKANSMKEFINMCDKYFMQIKEEIYEFNEAYYDDLSKCIGCNNKFDYNLSQFNIEQENFIEEKFSNTLEECVDVIAYCGSIMSIIDKINNYKSSPNNKIHSIIPFMNNLDNDKISKIFINNNDDTLFSIVSEYATDSLVEFLRIKLYKSYHLIFDNNTGLVSSDLLNFINTKADSLYMIERRNFSERKWHKYHKDNSTSKKKINEKLEGIFGSFLSIAIMYIKLFCLFTNYDFKYLDTLLVKKHKKTIEIINKEMEKKKLNEKKLKI